VACSPRKEERGEGEGKKKKKGNSIKLPHNSKFYMPFRWSSTYFILERSLKNWKNMSTVHKWAQTGRRKGKGKRGEKEKKGKLVPSWWDRFHIS